MNLPPEFVKTIENTFAERGRLFLEALPELIREAASRWHLTDIRPLENLSYNFVACARRGSDEVMLKLGVPDRELTSEIHCLRHLEGRGAVRLLESDSGRGMLLLERLRPGRLLVSVADDRECTRIAADVMHRFWRTDVSDTRLIPLRDWFDRLPLFRRHNAGSTGPLDAHLLEQAEGIARDFFAEHFVPTLIHGDLHHYNILSSQRGWLAIDPKGVIGPPGYEVGPFLLNPRAGGKPPPELPRLLRPRIEILSEALGMEKERLRLWGLAFAVLSAVWCIQEQDDFRADMQAARLLADLRF